MKTKRNATSSSTTSAVRNTAVDLPPSFAATTWVDEFLVDTKCHWLVKMHWNTKHGKRLLEQQWLKSACGLYFCYKITGSFCRHWQCIGLARKKCCLDKLLKWQCNKVFFLKEVHDPLVWKRCFRVSFSVLNTFCRYKRLLGSPNVCFVTAQRPREKSVQARFDSLWNLWYKALLDCGDTLKDHIVWPTTKSATYLP